MDGPSTRSNPYIGPRPFTTSERHLFFGRDGEARRLLQLVVTERLVLFYAQSGAGKSSLINARLVPGLENSNYYVLPIGRVSGQREAEGDVDNPFVYNLLLSLQSENTRTVTNVDGDNALAHTTLPNFLANLYIPESAVQEAGGNTGTSGNGASKVLYAPEVLSEMRPLALIIDQFEELFTTHLQEWKKREDFFKQLRQAQEADPCLWVVLAMREDYIARLDPYAYLLGGIRARFYMERMSNEAALEAVRCPVQYLRPFEPGVAEELVDNLRRIVTSEYSGDIPQYGQYVDPVQLQVVCYQLWEHFEGEEGASIKLEDLSRLAKGGSLAQFISSALADFYEQAIASVMQAVKDDPGQVRVTERKLRDWFSYQLITKSETCNLVIKGEIFTGGLPNPVVELLADRFRFIIHTENRGQDTWYQLSHDRLVSPILQANRAWYERNPRPIQADAEAWAASGEQPDKLYEGRQLDAALLLLDDPQADLNDTEREFILASRMQQETIHNKEEARRSQEQARRNLILAIIFGLMGLVLAALTVFSFYQANIAEAASVQEAQQRRTAEAASGLANQQRGTAEAASGLANQQRQTAEAASALALQQAQEANRARATAQAAGLQEAEQRKKAEEAANIAQAANVQSQSSRLSSLSDYFRITNRDLSLLLAVEAFKTSSSLESRRALLNSIQSGMTNLVTRLGFPWYIKSRPYSITFNPDSSLVAVGTNGQVSLWNTVSSEFVTGLPTTFQGSTAMFSIAFDETGNLLARGGGDGKVYIWDRQANSTRLILPFDYFNYSSILSIAFQPKGNLLAVATDVFPAGSGNGLVYLYNYKDGTEGKINPAATYTCGSYACGKVAWSSDGTRLAIASKSGALQVIDVAQDKNLMVVARAHSSEITGLAWYPDGHRLVTSGFDQRLIQWDVEGQVSLRQATLLKKTIPNGLSLSPDGRFLLVGVNDVGDWYNLWNAETLQKVDFKPSGHTNLVTAVAFSPQGNRFVTTGFDNTVNMWNFAPVDSPSKLLSNLPGPGIEAVCADATGRLVFARNIGAGTLDIITDGAADKPVTVQVPHAGVACVQVSGKPAFILGGVNGQVSYIGLDASKNVHDPITIGDKRVNTLAISSAGDLLAAVSCQAKTACETLTLRDLSSGNELPLQGDLPSLKLQNISSLAFSPDAKTLVIGASTGKIILYDLATGETRQAVTEGMQNIPVTSLAYSPVDQGLLIAGFQDGRIALWDSVTLGPVGEFVERLNGQVTGLLLRKDSTSGLWSLVSTSSQGEVREWEIDPSAWVMRACKMAGRNLSPEEKAKFLLPGNPQEDFCPLK